MKLVFLVLSSLIFSASCQEEGKFWAFLLFWATSFGQFGHWFILWLGQLAIIGHFKYMDTHLFGQLFSALVKTSVWGSFKKLCSLTFLVAWSKYGNFFAMLRLVAKGNRPRVKCLSFLLVCNSNPEGFFRVILTLHLSVGGWARFFSSAMKAFEQQI